MDINLNRDIIIDVDLNNARIDKPYNASYYNTDSNIAFFYVKLHKKNATDITEYISKEDADNYKIVMTIVRSKSLISEELTGEISDDLQEEKCAIYKFVIKDALMKEVGDQFCHISITYNDQKLNTNGFTYTVKQDPLGKYNLVLLNDPDMPLLKALLEEIKNNVGGIDDENVRDNKSFSSYKTTQIANNLSSQIKEKANESDLDVERKRIDSFTALASGSTTGDAELIDGRIGADGYNYNNIGEAIRTQYKILNKDINNINEGKDTMRFVESDLELGNIKYSSGVLENHSTVKRTKNYITLEVGEEITVNVKNGNGVNLIFYDENGDWKESKSVSATTTTNTRTLTVNYPKVKIVFVYYSPDYPLSASNCSIIRELNFKKDIETDIDNIWSFINGSKTAESNNFNDLVDGAYWLSVSKTENNLVNAPNNYTYGDFSVLTKKVGVNYLQFAFTTVNSRLNQKRGFFRVFNANSGANIIKWSDLNVMFHKSQDNYVAFGDSITHGYQKTVNGVDTISNYQYWKTVGSILKLNAIEGANTGSGFVKVQGNKNALRIIEDYDFTDVNLVTLAFGTNDWNGNIPLGTIDDPAVNGNVNTSGTYTNDTNTIYSAIKYCVEKILSVDPKITIILITPINRSQVGSSGATLTKEGNWGYGATNTAGYTLSDVCEAVVNVAKYYGIPYIDNREGNPINRLTVKSLTVDGLHPSDWGYMKLGQYYAAKIGSIYRPYEI